MMKNCGVEGVYMNKKCSLILEPELLTADQVGKKAWLGWIEETSIWEESLKEKRLADQRHLMFNFPLKSGLASRLDQVAEGPV